MSNLKRHLNPATVISCLALFVALGGAAYAVSPIGNKSVKTQHLGNGAVTTLKLRNGAVTTAKLRNLSVTAPKLGEASITSGKLASGAVRSIALGGGVVTEGKIKDGSVNNSKLANNAVTSSKLAADAVSTGKLQDGAVTAAKLAPTLLSQLVKDVSRVTGTSGPADTVTATKTAIAECPAGKAAIGGGARIVGNTTKVALVASTPSDAFGTVAGLPRIWTATATAIDTEAVEWSVEAFAICAQF